MQQLFYFITLYNVQTDRIGSFVVRCIASEAGRPSPQSSVSREDPKAGRATLPSLARSLPRQGGAFRERLKQRRVGSYLIRCPIHSSSSIPFIIR